LKVQNNNYHENDKSILPKLSLALDYSDIERNDTYLYRLFESVNFTVNASKFSDVDHVRLEISFKNGPIESYDMIPIGSGDNYYYIYKPGYGAPLGLHNVSFLIYNISDTLLNDHTTYTNFSIDTNCGATFIPKPEYYIGDTLSADLFLSNFSSSSKDYDFVDWDIVVVDSVNETTQNNLLDLGSNIKQVTFLIDNETFPEVNKIYYLKVNMTELNRGSVRVAYFPFNIINSNPVITSIIDISPNEVFRTDDFVVSINASDIESASENLTTYLLIQDSQGNDVLEEPIGYRSKSRFSDTFTIPYYSPIGNYRVNVTVIDEHGGLSSKITFLTVKNNAPKIHSYKINGQSMNQSISVQYGRDLVFSFNVSDIEGVAYIKVALIDENNEWFNITRTYEGEDTKITIRTIELITGMWFVYIYVIDSDGAVTSLIDDYNMAPQGIRVIPDVLSNYLPWIVFFFGLTIGLLAGMGILYRYFKSKFVESQAPPPKKKEALPKKPLTKKKVKAKQIKEEEEILKKEELEAEEGEKEGVPKRKIKRKL
jgi:PKD repeat protein